MTAIPNPARRLAQQLRPDDERLRLRQGVVDAVNGDGTVDVTLGGSDVVIAGVSTLGHVVVGEAVWLLQQHRDVLALASPGWRGPRGVIGYSEATSDQTGVDTTEVDLTGLSVPVDVGTGRRIRVTLFVHVQASDANGVSELRIRDSGATAQVTTHRHPAAGLTGEHVHILERIWDGGLSGSRVFKGVMRRVGGSGTLETNASAILPNFIVAEDIGPAV